MNKLTIEDVIDFIKNKAEESDLRQIRNVVTRVLYGRHRQKRDKK